MTAMNSKTGIEVWESQVEVHGFDRRGRILFARQIRHDTHVLDPEKLSMHVCRISNFKQLTSSKIGILES